MITEELYYKIQAILDGRNTNIDVPIVKYNNDNPEFPLRRIVKCSKCGTPFTGAKSKGKLARYAYYFCRSRCVTTSVPPAVLEEAMVKKMQEISPTKECLDMFIALVRRIYYKRISSLQKRRENADQEIKKLRDIRQVLVEKNLAGVYSGEMFKEQNRLIEEKIAVAQLAKNDALVDKYNLETIITFMRDKFGD